MSIILEGNIAIKAALLANKRNISKILVSKNKIDKDTGFILNRAKDRNIEIVKTSKEEIDLMSIGKTHGGLIALCSPRVNQNIDELSKAGISGYYALIEGIEDPFNYGYILRTLYAMGCNGVISRKRDWSTVDSTIVKSSAGASEYINIYEYDNVDEIIQLSNKQDIPIICAYRDNAISLDKFTFPENFIICIGGEMRGLSKEILSSSSFNLYIPYANEFRNALNGASAVSMLAYEIYRQRQ